MDRQALAVTLPELKRGFNLAERRVGMVEGCFGFAFAAGSLLFGLVGRDDLDGPAEPDPTNAAAPLEPPDGIGFARRLVVLAVVVACLTISWQFLRAWLPLLLDFHGYNRLDTRAATSGYFIAAEIG